jgi:hypothetical protein
MTRKHAFVKKVGTYLHLRILDIFWHFGKEFLKSFRKSFLLFGLDLGQNGCISANLIETLSQTLTEKVLYCLAWIWVEMAVLVQIWLKLFPKSHRKSFVLFGLRLSQNGCIKAWVSLALPSHFAVCRVCLAWSQAICYARA